MSAPGDSFSAGYAAFRSGDFVRARRLLAASRHPQALHLRGLVERRLGNLQRAAELLEKAAAREPGNHEIAHNRALVALDRGRAVEAETHAQQALALQTHFERARRTLGRALLAQGRWRDAEAAYAPLLDGGEGDGAARYGWATARLEQGDAETALEHFDALVAGGMDAPQVRFMRARARLELGRIDAALSDLRDAHRGEPTPMTLRELGNVLWMTGREDELNELLDAAAADPALAATAAELWRQRDAPGRAVDVAAGGPPTPERLVARALAHIDAGEPDAAERAARACLEQDPDSAAAVSALLSALLMRGDAEKALQVVAPFRRRDPLGQHWIAYEATALRLIDRPAYERLVDLERLVRPFELPVPPGYASLADFNAALEAALAPLHHYATHPLGQSLRQGSQTSRDLRSVDDPVIRAYLAALDAPIRAYLDHVGRDPAHPLTARNRGTYRFAGCWSVWLRGGGRHVSHVHPEGWISSAYYVRVPAETAAGDDRAGWIKFGEPPFPTAPPSPPEKWVQPRAGLLVLFPSFLWHGTAPIHDGSVRITAPFDAVPGEP